MSRTNQQVNTHGMSSSMATADVPPASTTKTKTLQPPQSSSTNHIAISIPSHVAVIINDPTLTDARQEEVSCHAAGTLTQDVDLMPPGRPTEADAEMNPESEPLIVPDSQPADIWMNYTSNPMRAMVIPPVNTHES
ncbi:hypothetical protein K2173_002862 [Erythroxylum novogranatense]|uniref:Uncharacterized protein n=1 Tax=Erythroxylum novogranatense TaxID=1862640 RepID=A0AAV8SQX0_9ROSI|nr:hypothetical protein K2173_002862 [Erythroxylum novogranatense]